MPVFRGAAGLALCLLTFVLACGSDPDPKPGEGADNDKVAALTLSPREVTLLVGETLTLAPVAVDDAGRILKDIQVTWSRTVPGAVTVSDGQLTGVAVGGSVITARVGAVSATLTAVVMPSDPSGPSSDEVLTSAHEAGLINDEELLAYRVYASFRDPRLPLQYKARVGPGGHATALLELHERFDTLSQPMQEALGMYLLRPSDPGSWVNNASRTGGRLTSMVRPICLPTLANWEYISTDTAKVRVWYEIGVKGQRTKATKLFDAVEKEIWPKLMGLGLKEPLTDESSFCNGGSPQLDIFLDRTISARGLTIPDGFDNTQAPTYILLSSERHENEIKGSAAHELMHAIQWSYKMKASQKSYGWIREATATWAIDYVYDTLLFVDEKNPIQPQPQQQLDHVYAGCFMNAPHLPLESVTTGRCTNIQAQGAGHDYGAYVFFQYLTKKYGASLMVGVMNKLTTETSSLTAVDSVVPGKLEKVWPEFAKTLWNQPPVDSKADSFKTWDKLEEKTWADKSLDPDLNGVPERKSELHEEINNLSNLYYTFTFKDPATRSMLFHNGWFKNITESKDPLKVFAFWSDAAGTWYEEDWSEYEYVGFCRDMKAQRVQDLIIVVSNAKFQAGGGGTLKSAKTTYLKRNNVGCWKFKGAARSHLKGPTWSGKGKVIDATLEFAAPAGYATSDYDDPNFPNTKRVGAFMLMLPQGNFTLDVDYGSGGCRYTHGPAQYPLNAAGGALLLNPFNELKSPDADIQAWLSHPARSYSAGAADASLIHLAVSGGPDCKGPELDMPGSIILTDEGAAKPVVLTNGDMAGQFFHADVTYNWTLLPQAEP
jgi:hypothetical protein